MTSAEMKDRAIAEIERNVPDTVREPRVVHGQAVKEWCEPLLTTVAEHELNVLGRGADLVVFFDEDGREIGWRDDGRHGAEAPEWIDRESFRQFVIRELELPIDTRLGQLKPAVLPPVGWTHQGILFLSAAPTPDQILRVWVDPTHNRVIQCLHGAAAPEPQETGS